jgi:phage gpG-like protein
VITEIKVLNEDSILTNIEKMRERAKEAKPATRKAKDLFVKWNKETFESEGSFIGKPWAPLTEATMQRKEREGINAKPMHGKTGDLETSLKGGKGKRTGATKSSARAGSGVFYARFARGTKGSANSHNTGEVHRDLVGMPKDGPKEVLDLVSDWVLRGRLG